jgi:DNA (cytosine-5)-methyltransferase 1
VDSIDEPLRTITGAKRGEKALLMPTLARTAHGEFDKNGKKRGRGEHSIEEPLPTTTASPDLALVSTFVSSYYGDKRPTDVRGGDVDQPLHTQTTENRHALISAFLAQHNAGPHNENLSGREASAPISTITSRGTQQQVVAAMLSRQFGNSTGSGAGEPLGTTTAGGGGKSAVVVTHIMKMRGTNIGSAADEPLHTVSAGGTHQAEVRAFLLKYYGNEREGHNLKEPAGAVTAKDRFGLVTVQGEDFVIIDIGMRMLTPRELFRAQGFPDDYIIDRGVDPATGEEIKLTKTAQVRMCGNSVSPPPAEALVRANFGISQREERVA